jgi:uncharacterized protein with GYD domain
MPKYLLKINYTVDGVRALQSSGGSARRKVAEEAAKSVGGSLEAFYFALGSTDAYVVGDFPDNTAAAALALAVTAGGAVAAETVALLTPEEIDQAVKKDVAYRPTGS